MLQSLLKSTKDSAIVTPPVKLWMAPMPIDLFGASAAPNLDVFRPIVVNLLPNCTNPCFDFRATVQITEGQRLVSSKM